MKKEGKRLKDSAGIELDFTCDNSQYNTNINKGIKHYRGQKHKGAVVKIYDDGYSLLYFWSMYLTRKNLQMRFFG